jgi:hypothetical protein
MYASRTSVKVCFYCLHIINYQVSTKKNRTLIPQKSSLTARPTPITPMKRRSKSSTWKQSKKGKENRMTKRDIGNGKTGYRGRRG